MGRLSPAHADLPRPRRQRNEHKQSSGAPFREALGAVVATTGSGIGLAMTFRVVQMHSGTIDFVTEERKGTSFRMRFPGLARQGGEPPLSKAAGSGRRL